MWDTFKIQEKSQQFQLDWNKLRRKERESKDSEGLDQPLAFS